MDRKILSEATNNQHLIKMMGSLIEMRDLDRTDHIENVGRIVQTIGYEYLRLYPKCGLTKDDIDTYMVASYLHDIGKITIPDSILLKPGKLTTQEFDMIKSHTSRGCNLLTHFQDLLEEKYLRAALDICKHHHERYDGTGYPDKLVGDSIPLSAQLTSIADVYDSILHESVYEIAHTKEEAFHMIISGQCGMFSPKILECFRNVQSELEQIESSAMI